ncbi:hypothetical protein CSB09_00975 [Candidatus Gracilibacteria bacterium]|nr:MAG: hypothetical protein CSB09_00975 [Candidatus Gracilibacteria bacterium]
MKKEIKQKFHNFWDTKWGELNENIGPTQFGLSIKKYLKSGKKILDIGCGAGRDTHFFSKLGLFVDALDFSENALKNISGKNITPICASCLEYDYPENSYDYIYACNSLHYFYLEEFQKIIDKIYTSLKKGGLLFLRVKSIDDVNFGKGEVLAENYYRNKDDTKYYFSESILQNCLKKFEIITIKSIQDEQNKIDGTIAINGFIDVIVKK